MTRKEYAISLFSNGSNCSQAVATPFALYMDIERDTIHRLCTGFGAGIGKQQNVCGAVSGGVCVISGLFGNTPGINLDKKENTYKEVKDFLSFIEKNHSSIICEGIIGRKLKTTDEWAKAGEDNLFGNICAKVVSNTVSYLEELIVTHREKFLQIHKADIRDCDEIISIQEAAFLPVAERHNNHNMPPLLETTEELKEKFTGLSILKGTWNGRIIASIRLRKEGNTAHIGRLVVLPSFQRIGIGRILIREIEKAAEGTRRFEIFTAEKDAHTIALYESEGFKIFKTDSDNSGVPLVFMEKLI